MNESDLITDLKASLNDAAKEVFDSEAQDGAFKRHLKNAALDFARVRPRRRSGELSLTAGVGLYDAPADFHEYGFSTWGADSTRLPWEDGYPQRRPDVIVEDGDSGLQLRLTPPPTHQQIQVFGATFTFTYSAGHVIGETDAATSIRAADRGLLLLRAQAETMKELAFRGSKKPVQLRDGLQSAPSNGTPAALYDQLMKQFNAQAMH